VTIDNDGHRIKVSLSMKDWLWALTALLSVVSLFLAAYLRHDRMLTELVSSQRMTEHRLTQIERNLP